MVKAVLFDMDGVLIDSTKAWFDTFNTVLLDQGLDPVSFELYEERISGQSVNDDLRFYFTDLTVAELSGLYEKFFSQNLGKIIEFKDTHKVLEDLKEGGAKIAVITNSPKPTAFEILDHFQLTPLFDEVLTGEDVSEGKPSPEIVLTACQRLGVKSEDTLVVGDTQNDIDAGHAAGCKVVGVGIKADYTIQEIGELPELLENR